MNFSLHKTVFYIGEKITRTIYNTLHFFNIETKKIDIIEVNCERTALFNRHQNTSAMKAT